ncbi:MAG: DsrE family protein [Paracoccaceae bacterium]|jgi:predicted peroxiredoxin|nr:DsrE family protein [Paracoccaceae bacterium]
MATILVHIHTGPGDATKAALGLLVAATAAKKGHAVSVFLAGDGVHLLGADTAATLEGVGTGKVSDHLAALSDLGVRFHVSGMSAKARGYDESLLAGQAAEFAMPDRLVDLATEADTVLCY